MRILKIFDGDYPWDVRVEKVTRSLSERGHEVVLLCRNRQRLPRRELLAPRVSIARLPGLPGPLTFPFFFNPLWRKEGRVALSEFRPDLVLVRDLPLAPLGLYLARLAGIPVVADLAEPYPDSLRTHFQLGRPTLGDFLVRNPRLADIVERYVLTRIDHAIVVCPEAGWRLERQGLPRGNWTEVRNTADLRYFRAQGAPAPELEGLEDRFLILFNGLMSHDRGLEVALDAMAELTSRSPERYALLIVGEGPMKSELQTRAAALGLGSQVRFADWINYTRVPDLISQASLGLMPFHRCPHIVSSLANKLFEYMSLGLPFVATDIAPMARVIRDADCGATFPSGDSKSLARTVDALASSPALLQKQRLAGRRAARRIYNWEIDGGRLVDVVEWVVAKRHGLGNASCATGQAPLLKDLELSNVEDFGTKPCDEG